MDPSPNSKIKLFSDFLSQNKTNSKFSAINYVTSDRETDMNFFLYFMLFRALLFDCLLFAYFLMKKHH